MKKLLLALEDKSGNSLNLLYDLIEIHMNFDGDFGWGLDLVLGLAEMGFY